MKRCCYCHKNGNVMLIISDKAFVVFARFLKNVTYTR